MILFSSTLNEVSFVSFVKRGKGPVSELEKALNQPRLFIRERSGIDPENLLPPMFRNVRFVSSDRLFGTVPVRLLFPRSKDSTCVRRSRSGNDPSSPFSRRFRIARFVKMNKSLGIVPESSGLETSRNSVRPVNVENPVGITPVNWLNDKSKNVKLNNGTKLSRGPLILVLAQSSDCNMVIVAMFNGSVPEIFVLPRLT